LNGRSLNGIKLKNAHSKTTTDKIAFPKTLLNIAQNSDQNYEII
jgi:hypothetical protein